MAANGDIRASDEDCAQVDKLIWAGGSFEEVVDGITAFAMRGLYGSGFDTLADQTEVTLSGGVDNLSPEKARDIFETIDVQSAVYRSCGHTACEEKILEWMQSLVQYKLAGVAPCVKRVEQLRQDLDRRKKLVP
eukprot:m.15777 g.15777  ORF g.15777 m.15777 type:complete len:134 (-) comp8779_c0_seq1:294-695(-)